MTNPLSTAFQEAQKFTEQTKNELHLMDDDERTLSLVNLAKNIVPLFAKSKPNTDSPTGPLNESRSAVPTPIDGEYSKNYAQKCVLECPELFPFFIQLFPDLSLTLEEMIEKRLEEIRGLTGPLYVPLNLLCQSLPITKNALEVFLNKIETTTAISPSKKDIVYMYLEETFDKHNLLTDYIANHPKVSAHLAIETAEHKIERLPLDASKICICLSAFTKAQGWGYLPPSLESQILKIEDLKLQKKVLHRTIELLNKFAEEKISFEQFTFLIRNQYVKAALDCEFRDEVEICITKMMDVAKNEASRNYSEGAFQTFRDNCPQNELDLLPDYTASTLHLFSMAHLRGVSKMICDGLIKQACTYFKEGAKSAAFQKSKDLEMYLSILDRIVNSGSLDLRSKEYLLDKISKEPALIPCIRMIQSILEVSGEASLRKEILEIATFKEILLASCRVDAEFIFKALSSGAPSDLIESQSRFVEIDSEVATMTSEILSTDGFKQEQDRDLNYNGRNGQTVAEVQGSTSFCKKTVEHAIKSPSVLSPSLLRDQQNVNQALSLALRYKRIGHAFNVDAMAKLPNGNQICLTGFNETFVIPMLRSMFDAFMDSRIDPDTQGLKDFVGESLSKAVWHDNVTEDRINEIHELIHNPDYHHPVVVSSGWVWHSTQAIFHGDYLYYCNRGADCDENPGICILKIKNKEKITPEFLKRIASRLAVKHSEYTSLEKIKEELGADHIDYIPMKEQIVGNCVYVNAKAAIFTLILIGMSRVSSENNGNSTSPFNKEDMEMAKDIYKDFSQFDKESVLEDFLIDLEEAGTGKLSLEENKNYLEGLSKVADVLKNWVVTHCGKNRKIGINLLSKTLMLVCLKDWSVG